MHVGMLSSISWRTPPHGYGPWELVTSLLTEALVARGIDVTLFATADSVTSGMLEAIVPRGYSEDPAADAKVLEIQHVAHFFEQAHRFDILHNQADFLPLAFSRLVTTPMITTIHGFSSEQIVPVYARYNDRVTYVSISDADRHPALSYARTIHHGIRLEDFPYNPAGGEDLLFFGRIHPDKGAAEAIRAAKAAGHRLTMAGIVQDHAYYEQQVRPFLDGETVRHIGMVGGAARAATLGNAKALLHLIGFDEPFGLSVVEALACGTPVIAYRRGSMPEIIEDGVTGFLVDDLEQAIAAIGRISRIDRRACRSAAASRFSVDQMTGKYIGLYEEIVQSKKKL